MVSTLVTHRSLPFNKTFTYNHNGQTLKVTVSPLSDHMGRCFTFYQELNVNEWLRFERPYKQDEHQLSRVGQREANLVKALMRIEGITWFYISTQKLNIQLGEAFNWVDIEPYVLKTIQNVLLEDTTPAMSGLEVPLRIKEEASVNETMQTFHVNRQLSEAKKAYFFHLRTLELETENKEEVGTLARRLLIRLRLITGLETLHFKPYEITVFLKEGFVWTPTLKARVKKIITDVLTLTPAQHNS